MLLFALCLSFAGLMHGTARAATSSPRAIASGLAATFNNVGISDDSAPASANLDNVGYSFSAQGLADDGWSPGAVVTLADGAAVHVPQIAPGQNDNTVASGQAFADAGSGGALDLVATSTNGTTSGTGTVTYADGTTQSFAMSVPDWWSGTVGIAAVAPYRNSSGGAQVHQVSLYLTSVPLVAGKAVASVALPTATGGSGSAMHVFAVAFGPSAPVAGSGVGVQQRRDQRRRATCRREPGRQREQLLAAGLGRRRLVAGRAGDGRRRDVHAAAGRGGVSRTTWWPAGSGSRIRPLAVL